MSEQELAKRKTIKEIYLIKLDLLSAYSRLEKEDKNISLLLEQVNNYSLHRLEYKTNYYGENRIEKEIDKKLWQYLVDFFHLNKYMLCTEYDKVEKQIEDFNFPVFNLENVDIWLSNLKKIVTKISKS